jgi:ABC-type dipeptide/oligopeptide/nickel transport system permease component
MLPFLVRRVLWGLATLVLTAFFAFGMIRLLRPELYGGQSLVTGTWTDVRDALLHLRIGGGPSYPPLEDPWAFIRSMLVPWLVVGLPLAASMMRLTLALTVEAMGEEWVRTAEAKGLRHGRVVRRHAAPSAFPTVAWLFGASAPILVLNMVLVEYVFSVPGFFRHMRKALGQNEGLADKVIDIPMLQAIALWAAVLIVALSLIGDLAIMRLDPRVRTSGKAIG